MAKIQNPYICFAQETYGEKKIERMEEKLKGWKRLHCPNFTNQNRVGVNIVIFDVIIFNAKKNHTETVCIQVSRNTSQL